MHIKFSDHSLVIDLPAYIIQISILINHNLYHFRNMLKNTFLNIKWSEHFLFPFRLSKLEHRYFVSSLQPFNLKWKGNYLLFGFIFGCIFVFMINDVERSILSIITVYTYEIFTFFNIIFKKYCSYSFLFIFLYWIIIGL